MLYTQTEYNNEPVHYCVNCLSLALKELNGIKDMWACRDCGTTKSQETNINIWENLYRSQYKQDFLTGEPVEFPMIKLNNV